jgi:hypothetical protein
VTPRRRFALGCAIVLLLPFGILGGIWAVYLRLGTDVVTQVSSPDGHWAAVLMTRNCGAPCGDYLTDVVIVNSRIPLARDFAWCCSRSAFLVDSDHGAAAQGESGQVDVLLRWRSNSTLVVSYPERTRIFKRLDAVGPIGVEYVRARPD